MRILVALGGNALLRRGEAMTAENQRKNVRIAAEALAPLGRSHELVISHGNGPQVGLLALQGDAYRNVETYPLDVLGAQTEGMIGYVIEQELGNILPFEQPFATILSMVEVDPDDPAFAHPTKPIGPVYTQEEARQLEREKGWTMAPDGDKFRRVVPSPKPKRIFQIRPVKWLLEKGCIVICAGGGGIPTMYGPDRTLSGAEAVVDKDRASALLARELEADLFIMATDADAVYLDWGKPAQRAIRRVPPHLLDPAHFAAGSMGPKVEAAKDFAERTGKVAAIGALADLERIARGEAGTLVTSQAAELEIYPPRHSV
jgi:carbamate kinase